ncbi:MAG: TDT family transporter [Anaeromicrobium sp.]|jgi:exfoliative toxin A/B|uniref:TDT family transporter n=1 Tax=Anaeromicrobium sp. TaxID=1929132 RepID=UPI0025F12C9C|nr:TDT family transporter [Anaeromicrobium sp.]MCT4594145.1 TDT family transporter [Anaeromicrobium sp.]
MKDYIKSIPLPIAGLMLGLAACGNLVSSYGLIFKYICGFFSFSILFLLIFKIILLPKVVSKELENPIVNSVFLTLPMAVMILSTYIIKFHYTMAFLIWSLGLGLHILLLIDFTKKYILNFNMTKVFPSYFIVYAGIVVGSITCVPYKLQHIGKIIFYFGLTSYIILLPIVIYRLIKLKITKEPAMPTVLIMAAPGSLCLAGYLSSFSHKNETLVYGLLGLSLLMTLYALIRSIKLLSLRFYPSYSAFTFPFVISAIAMKKSIGYLTSLNVNTTILKYIFKIEELFAISMVFYVLILYMINHRKSITCSISK